MRIEILDTTLRDGAQGEGVLFSPQDKLKVIRALDALGVDYIEAGNPGSNPKDRSFYEFAREKLKLKHAKLAAFGSTCRVGARAPEDAGLQALVESGVRHVCMFGKSSIAHVEHVLITTREENLRIIQDSIAYLVSQNINVFFDAEHFFDGFAQDADYAIETLYAAKNAGASRVCLCDTNGGTLPDQIERITRVVVKQLGMPVAIHGHNDSGLATACSLAGVRAGATQVQGTINGYGERCGNADLCQVIPNLVLKMGYTCLLGSDLTNLAPTAREVAEIANITMDEHSPYVGRSAFAHKGGMHVDGMMKLKSSFEHIDPELVGNARRYLVSEVSGRGALMTRLALLAPDLQKDSESTRQIMDMLKSLESEGYSFEGAEGSLSVRVLSCLGRRRAFFEVLDFHVVSRKPETNQNAQAFVKVLVDGQQEITADEGDGPVNALDLAVRKALSRFYPCLSRMRLSDFKVRVVQSLGTASKVRVTIESTDGLATWSTVGVSTNIIEASLIALTDSIDYMLMRELDALPTF